MNIRIFNAKILTMGKSSQIQEGELWVEGNKISYIGEKKPASISWDKEIDAEGNLILPGFKNAHTHSAMTFLRSYADDLPLFEWLNNKVFPLEVKIKGEDIYWCSKLAIMECLTSGITANFDMYFHTDMRAKASVECGFRTVMLNAPNNFNSSLEELEADYIKYNNYHPLISYCLGFHAEYTTNIDLLKGIAELSKKYKAPVFAHNSETKGEVEGCIERWGKTPTELMESIDMFCYGGGGYHCVHMTDHDLEIFKERNLWAVTNPASNVKLASGIAPIAKMLNMGVNLAIGTDGPASNNCLDMFREMFLVTGLAKLKEEDASAVAAEEVLKMAVTGGAKAMGLTDCDCLEEGKIADLIMIDLHQPNMQPLNNIVKNLVYSGSKQNVKMTMVNGEILYENGKFNIGVDPEVVYQKVNEIIESIK